MAAFITAFFISVGFSATAAAIATWAVTTAASALVASAIGAALRGGSGGGSPAVDARGRLVSVRQSIAPRQVIYGEVRAAGVITHTFVERNSHLHMVHTLAGHPIEAVDDIYFFEYALRLETGNTGITSETGSRYIGTLSRARYSLGDEAAGVQPFAELQAATGSSWTATHNQTGCAKLWTRMQSHPNVYPNGVPPVTALVRGKKVYDPRTSLTVWTRNAALIMADYLVTPRAQGGLGVDYTTGIDEDALIAAANVCDERVTLSGNDTTLVTFSATKDTFTVPEGGRIPRIGDGVRFSASGSPAGHLPAPLLAGTTYYVTAGRHGGRRLATSVANALTGTYIDITGSTNDPVTMTHYDEARYCADGRYLTSAQPKQVLANMRAAMAGKLVNVGGKWFIYAGAYEAATITLTANDLAGALQGRPLLSRRDNANGVKGVCVDPSQHWQVTDFPPVAPAAYAAQDGGRVWRELDLSGLVTSPTQAQRIAKIHLLQLRNSFSIEAPFKLGAYRVATGRTFALTFPLWGLAAKEFTCESLKFSVDAQGRPVVQIQATETAAAIFDWSTSEESTTDIAPNTTFEDPNEGLEIDDLTASSGTDDLLLNGDGTVVPRVRLRWTTPENEFVERYLVQVSKDGSPTEWQDCPTVLAPATEAFAIPVRDGDVVDLRIAAVTSKGGIGEWFYVLSHTVVGKTEPPSDVENFTAVQQGVAVVLACDPPEDADLDAVEVRLNRFDDDEWGNGTPIANILRGLTSTTASIKPGTHTLLAKNRDTSGNYSLNAARADVQVTNEGFLTIDSFEAATSWPGLQFQNLLTQSCSGLWIGSGLSAVGGLADPWGGTQGWEVRETAGSSKHYIEIFAESALTPGDVYCASGYVAPVLGSTSDVLYVRPPVTAASGGVNGVALFGVNAKTGAFTGVDASITEYGCGEPDAAGYRRWWAKFTSISASASMIFGVDARLDATTYAGVTTDAVKVTGFQINTGVRPTPFAYTSAVAKNNRDNLVISVSGKAVVMSTRLMSSVTEAEFDAGLWPDPEETYTYTAPEVDKGVDAVARIYASFDSDPAPGEAMASQPVHRVDWKLDAGAYDGFEDWSIGSVRFRQVKSGLRGSTADGSPVITSFETVIDAELKSEDGLATTSAGGSAAVEFETEFNQAPFMQVSPQGTGDVTASYDSLTADGVTVYHKTAGAASAGTVSWRAQGG